MDNYTPVYIILILLKIYLINGVVEYSTSGEKYIGENFTLTYIITPSFMMSAVISQNTISKTNCLPGFCTPATLDNVTFTPSGTGINVVFTPLSSSHQGNWQCDNADGNFSVYTLQPATRPSGSSGSPDNTNQNIGIGVGTTVVLIVGIALAIVLYRIYPKKGPSFAPQQPLALEFTSSDFVHISWKGPQNVNQIKYHIDAESMPSKESLSLAKDILDAHYDVKISKLRGSKVRFSVKSEYNYVVSKPLFSQQYLLLGEKFKPNGPLQVKLQNKQCILSWQLPIHDKDNGDIQKTKYDIDVLLQGSSNWKNIKDNVVELTCSVDPFNMQNQRVLFRVIAKHDNDISVPLIAEENFYIDPKHFE